MCSSFHVITLLNRILFVSLMADMPHEVFFGNNSHSFYSFGHYNQNWTDKQILSFRSVTICFMRQNLNTSGGKVFLV